MKFELATIGPSLVNINQLKSLYQDCKWDWLEPDVEMRAALEGSFRLYGATSEGRLIGFCRLLSDGKIYGLLIDCIVHPDFRKNGVGKGLVDLVISQSRKDGLKVLQLLASQDGFPVYQKAGFTSCPEASPGMVKFLVGTIE